jgi:hypothetical protein
VRILKNIGFGKPPISRFSVQWSVGLSMVVIAETLMPQRCRDKLGRRLSWTVWMAAASLLAIRSAEAADLSLEMQRGAPCLLSKDWAGYRLVLQRSATLTNWQEVARVRSRLLAYPDLSGTASAGGFYRIAATALQPSDDWSNQLLPANGELFTPGSGSGLAATRFAKFSLLLAQPDRVYFQDSLLWPYHYHFAVARLSGYAGMSILQYNRQALYANADQRIALGAVMRAPDPQVREVGIEIVGAEAFPIERVADWFEAVRRRLVLEDGWRVFYMPSTEQRAAAEAGVTNLAARGIALASLSRWASESADYSTGWALGKLVFVAGTNVSAALGDGRLHLGDILVTDRVPAELPVLAGYLALEPATPNSHVALLARSLALPFAYANGAGLQAEIASLYGKEVLLVIENTNNVCRITLTDTTGLLTPERRQEILDSKKAGALDITPIALAGTNWLPVDPLTPADICYVGGKAANFGFLRRSLPNDTPTPVIAFTFDLWEAYLAQTLPGGQTLRQQIEARLRGYTYPPDVNSLRTNLTAIRALITDTADFNATQRTQIVAALQQAGFSGRKIRFRSSTNVEDTDSFNGAGLYDSYSGCLEDDLDGNTTGPSLCDPTEPNERGVFRALRKVYASFYNENAFLERLRFGVVETNVGMAVSAALNLVTPSSLTTNGAPVMPWESDYRLLLDQLNTATLAYEAYYPVKTVFELDFEFKRLVPGHVGLKQIRAVPHPVLVPPPTIP